MKSNFFIKIIMLGFIVSLPIAAKHAPDEYLYDFERASRESEMYSCTTNYFDKTLAWTDQKIKDLKASIRKHPWRYAAGITAVAALIGLTIYKLKIKSVPLSKSAPIIPPTVSSSISQQVEPIEAIARAIPAHVPTALPQQSPKQFLVELQKAVETDLFRVECLMGDRMHGIADLESFKQITATNHIAELHAGLKKVKDAFFFVAGFEVNPPQAMHEMHRLHNNLKLMQQSIQEALPRYN